MGHHHEAGKENPQCIDAGAGTDDSRRRRECLGLGETIVALGPGQREAGRSEPPRTVGHHPLSDGRRRPYANQGIVTDDRAAGNQSAVAHECPVADIDWKNFDDTAVNALASDQASVGQEAAGADQPTGQIDLLSCRNLGAFADLGAEHAEQRWRI